jgi:hypothetical protein
MKLPYGLSIYVTNLWQGTLTKRSQRGWAGITKMANDWLSNPRDHSSFETKASDPGRKTLCGTRAPTLPRGKVREENVFG